MRTRPINAAATPKVTTQARTVRNFVNSARTSCVNPSRPTGWRERYGATGVVIAAPRRPRWGGTRPGLW